MTGRRSIEHRTAGERPPDERRDPDVERALAVLRERGREVRERELDRALAELDLTDRQSAAVEALAERLVAGVLAEPVARLAAAESGDADGDLPASAIALFS